MKKYPTLMKILAALLVLVLGSLIADFCVIQENVQTWQCWHQLIGHPRPSKSQSAGYTCVTQQDMDPPENHRIARAAVGEQAAEHPRDATVASRRILLMEEIQAEVLEVIAKRRAMPGLPCMVMTELIDGDCIRLIAFIAAESTDAQRRGAWGSLEVVCSALAGHIRERLERLRLILSREWRATAVAVMHAIERVKQACCAADWGVLRRIAESDCITGLKQEIAIVAISLAQAYLNGCNSCIRINKSH